jgi:hypothetical protein
MTHQPEFCDACGGTGHESCGSVLCRDGSGRDCCACKGKPRCSVCDGTGFEPCAICLEPGSVPVDVIDGHSACESCRSMPANDTTAPIDADRWERELLATHGEFVAELKEAF